MKGQQVVVIGAGPAGLAAASAAAATGAAVLILEERTEPGGQLRYRAQPILAAEDAPAERPERIAERLVNDALLAGADLRTGALVAASFAGNELLVVESDRTSTTVADAIVVATGSTDLPYPFAGGTLPGVFSARGLQILMNQWRVRPGRRFAIIGSGVLAEELAIDILLAGGEVVWSGIAPGPFLNARGEGGVTGLKVGSDEMEVDAIAIAVGRQADPALATMVGSSLAFCAALGGFVPVVDDRMQTTAPSVYVAGDAAGAGSVASAIAEGRLAGLAASAAVGLARDNDVDEARARGGAELAWRIAERAALTVQFTQPFE